jgi:hypothetical protein
MSMSCLQRHTVELRVHVMSLGMEAVSQLVRTTVACCWADQGAGIPGSYRLSSTPSPSCFTTVNLGQSSPLQKAGAVQPAAIVMQTSSVASTSLTELIAAEVV